MEVYTEKELTHLQVLVGVERSREATHLQPGMSKQLLLSIKLGQKVIFWKVIIAMRYFYTSITAELNTVYVVAKAHLLFM